MGPFTTWLASVQLDPLAEVPDAAAEVLFKEVLGRVRGAMRRWTRPGQFGSEMSDDQAMEGVRWFLARARDGTLPPAKVTDRDAVTAWIVREGWSRGCKRWKRDQDKPRLQGPSSLSGGRAGEPPGAAGMDPVPTEGRGGGSPHFNEADADALVKEALDGARADLRRWRGSDRDVRAFDLHVLGGLKLREAAEQLGVRATSSVQEWAMRGSFCVCRRLGWGAGELRRAFPNLPVDAWLTELAQLKGDELPADK